MLLRVAASISSCEWGYRTPLGKRKKRADTSSVVDAAGGQGFFEGLLDADLGQTGVGHDERFGTFEVLHFVSGFFNSAEAMHDLLDGVMHKSHCRILALLKSSYAEAGQSAALPCRRFRNQSPDASG